MFQEKLESFVGSQRSYERLSVSRKVKRGVDIVFSLFAMMVLAPFMLTIWLLVRRDGGSGLFRQNRVGRNGLAFECLKFRSMAADAEATLNTLLSKDPVAAEQWTMHQKLFRDPRITPVGRFLRRSNLDELPQLWNILRGDMSLVGPRPILFAQIGRYGPAIDAYVSMRPGLTGLWQVSGRHATTFIERARLDQQYVARWSLGADAFILLRTVREVLFPKGV